MTDGSPRRIPTVNTGSSSLKAVLYHTVGAERWEA
jgi:hypothetical protein